MKKLDLESKNIVEENIEKIRELFPNVVTESGNGLGINFDMLKQELSNNIIDSNKERYQLTWPGKQEAIYTANTRTTKTLRPLKEKSVNFDTTENIYIEGDNLEVLKILQESYLGKIKCIYIDPPYNTGKDFIYRDNFQGSSKEELMQTGQIDKLGNKFVANLDSNGRYHSDWLSMMYPRLKLARNLLTLDGVIFISIDENEYSNLKKVCDEIYGESNFVSTFIRNVSNRNQGNFDLRHEYFLVYMKKLDWKFRETKEDDKYDFEYENIKYSSSDLTVRTGGSIYSIPSIDGTVSFEKRWRLNENKMKEEMGGSASSNFLDLYKNAITFENGWYLVGKILFKGINKTPNFVKEYSSSQLINSYSYYNIETSKNAKKELINLFDGKDLFDFPKPLMTITKIFDNIVETGDIILDFFSGSATSAHALLSLNAKENLKCKYICVQLPEKCDVDSEAYKLGYNSICEIGQERIRRAAKKIKKETNADIDYGFRVYEVDESNMKDVYYKPNMVTQDLLQSLESNIKEGRGNADLLTQVILDLGLTLDLPIVERNISNNMVFDVDNGVLLACFDEKITLETIELMARYTNEYGISAEKIVVKESAFGSDKDLINAYEKIKNISVTLEMSVL